MAQNVPQGSLLITPTGQPSVCCNVVVNTNMSLLTEMSRDHDVVQTQGDEGTEKTAHSLSGAG